MNTFIKTQVAAFVSTAVDFSVTVFLVELFQIFAVPAGVIGNVVGALINFLMGKNWVFDTFDKNVSGQALRYSIVWIGYLCLMALGMTIIERNSDIHYVVSKIIVSVIVSCTYNYYAQRNFVFK